MICHQMGDCRPCAYFLYKADGCRRGSDCVFCHICDRRAAKKFKKLKKQRLKMLERIFDKEVESSCSGSVSADASVGPVTVTPDANQIQNSGDGAPLHQAQLHENQSEKRTDDTELFINDLDLSNTRRTISNFEERSLRDMDGATKTANFIPGQHLPTDVKVFLSNPMRVEFVDEYFGEDIELESTDSLPGFFTTGLFKMVGAKTTNACDPVRIKT
eukprot:TRINITY_DN64338_c0_g1_i1.p1 TRINITY_DN64338_c0_g1~~TRINITY_DN64338_c0_g1_i1.p1  ORF type:complete len:216 (-),score=29.65 TRINITY_DN64338_c0_g1_i1:156-803(-)